MDPFDWSCPHCNSSQTVNENNFDEQRIFFRIGKTKRGEVGISAMAVRCTNPDCLEPTIIANVKRSDIGPRGRYFPTEDPILQKRLIPESAAKVQPDYIPWALREDYLEACLIRTLSPKASATLARRCLQGMIRDFCGISKATLFQEIDALRKALKDGSAPRAVSDESVEAIDNVRGIGNIGAHMEKDIDHIVPVDPEEAQALIELIEMLFEEWYVAQHKREEKFKKLSAIAAEKKKLIADHKSIPKGD